MTHHSLRSARPWRAAALAVATTACVAFTTGCGDSDEPTSSQPDAPATTSATTAAASTGTTVTGKRKIGIIGNTFTSEILKRIADDGTATAKALGWETVVVDGQATPDGWNQGFQKLIGEDVDAILVTAIEAAPIQPSLTAAKKAGIPVIATSLDVFPDSAEQMTVIAQDTPTLGRQAADLIAERFPGESVISDDVSPVWAAHGFVEAAKTAFGTKGVTLDGSFDADLTDLVGSIAKGSAAQAQAHPKAKVYLSSADFAPPILTTSLQGIDRSDISIISRYSSPSTLKLLKAGAPVIALSPDVDKPIFKAFDRLLEHFAGTKPFDDSDEILKDQAKVIDKENPQDPYPFEAGLAKQVSTWGATYKIAGR